MTIDPDVAATARQWAGSSVLMPSLMQAVVKAEGNILAAVQCSEPDVHTREDALDVTARSATHAVFDFIKAQGLEADFVAFWGARWAPQGASNDPKNLNANWVRNVTALWETT